MKLGTGGLRSKVACQNLARESLDSIHGEFDGTSIPRVPPVVRQVDGIHEAIVIDHAVELPTNRLVAHRGHDKCRTILLYSARSRVDLPPDERIGYVEKLDNPTVTVHIEVAKGNTQATVAVG